jgi:hypothetical protein
MFGRIDGWVVGWLVDCGHGGGGRDMLRASELE